jgi:regulator of replication initiation timing
MNREEQIIRTLEAEVLQLQRNILLALQEVGSLRKENKLVRGRLEKADRVVECAITAREAWESYRAAHEPDREIYRYQAFEKVMRELGEVVAAYDGAANGS